MTVGAGPEVQLVQRLRVYVEPAGSFAVDNTGSLGSFTDVPMAEGTGQLTLTRETKNPLQVLQNVLDYQEEVVGKKAWTLNFSVAFAPTGVAASNGVAATVGSIQAILKAIMGGEFKGTGSTASAAWSTAGGGNVTAGTGFRAGGIAGWADTSGVVHFRPIKSRTGNAITLKVRFPSAPTTGQTIYSGASYFWTQDPDTSLQFTVEGSEQQDRWVLLGGQGTVTPQLALDGSIQMLQFAISGVKWLEADDAAGSASLHGTALSTATYNRFAPITGQAGRLLVKTNGSIAYTGATVHVNALTFTPGIVKTPVPSPSGVEGVLRWRATRASGTPAVAGTFGTFYEDFSYFDSRDTKDDKLVFYQAGVSAGSVVMVDAPTVQFTDAQRGDASGIAGQTISFKGRLDGDTSGTSSDQSKSPHRYHFG